MHNARPSMTWDLTSLNDAGSTSLYDLGPHAKIWTDLHRLGEITGMIEREGGGGEI